MPLFEVALVRTPSVAEQEQGVGETLLFGPVSLMAKDVSSASAQAGAKAGAKGIKLDDPQIQTLVRGFRG